MINEKRLLDEFFELIKIDSETGYERKIADTLLKKLKEIGVDDLYEDDVAEKIGHEAGNIFAFMKGNVPGAECILFNSHMDTVTPGVNIKASIVDGWVVSDGSTILGADDKSGVSALLEALRVIKEKNLPHGDIQIIFTTGEERGLMGARALDPKALKATLGFAFDTGGPVGGLKIEAPGLTKLNIEIKGTPVHAGNVPEKGVSAVAIGARAIANMPHGRIDHETTANVGSFIAESPTNIVTEKAIITAEARSLDMNKLRTQLDTMKKAFEDAAKELGGTVTIEEKPDCVAVKLSEKDTVVAIGQRAAAKVGRPCKLFSGGGASDANFFHGYGVPTVVLSCGFENAHAKNETIPLTELPKLAEMALAIVEEVVAMGKKA